MARRLRDSVVVITGASTGIGRAAALEFARCGAWVAIASRREAALQALARELEDAGGRALVCALDVTDEKAVNEMARRVVSTWGRVDTWVNNAAVTLFCRFEECPDDDFRRVMETNFFGVANGCRAVLPYFREQGEGVLINVSSMVGKVGSPFVSAYTASKFAIVGLTESIRGEVLDAPGVRVCAMLLGSIDTPLFQHAANYSGRQVKPLEPVLDVREAADAIVRCARRPRDEMRVGAATPMFVLHDLFPGWTSRQMARTVERRHFGEQTVGPQPGNLFQPMERYTSADGGWGGMRARRAAKAGAIGGLVGLGLLGAALLLADRGRVRAGFVPGASPTGGAVMKAPGYLANFDSSAAMVRALSGYLKGQDFPVLDLVPAPIAPVMEHVGALVNRLPRSVREQIYIWSGRGEAMRPGALHRVDAERLSRWVVGAYPSAGKFPAIAVGSSNGALVHLCSALHVPWLPQTFLIPVARSGVHPDEPRQDMEWGMEWAPRLLEANPDLQLHHMHDPNQDRLMIQRMTYFRVKRLALGEAYRRFIEERLLPGGEIWIVDCTLKWPTHRCGDRHFFQFGALGGASVEEFHRGSGRVSDYLDRYGSYRDRWDPPEPDADRPEAEWGFEPALEGEVMELARARGATVRRLTFEDPHAPSPVVAKLYRRWWRSRRLVSNRLLVSSFVVTEPYWTMRTGSVPFWSVFNKEPSAVALERFLEEEEPFDEINVMLFSHGVDSVGLAPIARWQALADRARRRGALVGVDEERYPRDFAALARYHYALRRDVRARYPLPAPLLLGQAIEHLESSSGPDGIRFATI